MRALMLTFEILAVLALTGEPAAAQNYPWCTNILGFGSESCGYSTYGQCMAALSGNGGFCNRNTQFVPPPGPRPAPAQR